MNLTRPLAVIDLETTGLDPVEDRIVSFAAVVLSPEGSRTEWEQTFNPGMPIPETATKIHGITDDDVKDKPLFAEHARRIWLALQGKDLAGFNLRSLDLPMLDEELRRCDYKLDLTGVALVDAFGIFAKKEPRDLATAVKKFCGREHEGSHGALADANATLDVLFGEMKAYPDVEAMTLAELTAFSRRDELDFVDLSGKLYRDSDGDLRYNFGQKTRHVKVRDDQGFADWVLRKNFPGSTQDALRAELDRLSTEVEDDGMPF